MTDPERNVTRLGAGWPSEGSDAFSFVEKLRLEWPPDDPEFLARVRQRICAVMPERGPQLAARVHVELTGDHPIVIEAVQAEWPPDDPEFLAKIGPP